MQIKDVINLIKYFPEFFQEKNNNHIKISRPWNFLHSSEENIPFNNDMGIFILSNHINKKWNISMKKNNNDIYFIGLSLRRLEEDIVKLFRDIKQDRFPVIGAPPYINNIWKKKSLQIPDSLMSKITNGELILYFIRPDQDKNLIVAIYTYLLNSYYTSKGQFPILNDKNLLQNI